MIPELPTPPHYQVVNLYRPHHLERLLHKTGNNLEADIIVGRVQLDDHVSCIQDIIEQAGIDSEKNYFQMSDIVETPSRFSFNLFYWNRKHGPYAVHCLNEITTYKRRVIIPKPQPSE